MRSQDIAMNGPFLLENAHKMAIDLGAEFDNATCQKLDKKFTSIQIVIQTELGRLYLQDQSQF